MTLDLAGPRSTAEATLRATCTIRSDTQGRSDDTLNTTTGALQPPDPDATIVYQGPCTIRPLSAAVGMNRATEGEADIYRRTYQLLLPVTAEPPIGAVATIDEVGDDGDPHLVGRELTVTEIAYSSRAVLRRCTAVDRRRGPRV